MVRALGIALIRFYQRHLSPRKGYCCAHRKLHGGASCSQFGLRVLESQSLLLFLPMMRRRFDRCADAAAVLQTRHEEKEEERKRQSQGTPSCGEPANCHSAGPDPCVGFDCFFPTSNMPACDSLEGLQSCDVGGCDGGCDFGGCG